MIRLCIRVIVDSIALSLYHEVEQVTIRVIKRKWNDG